MATRSWQARGAWLAGLLLAATAFGAAAQSTLTPEQLTIRVQRMSESTARTEAAMSDMQAQVKRLADEVGKMGRLIDNRAMLDMIQLVDNLGEEISQLRGLMEEQTFEIGEVKKRQRELYLDIDRRLRDLESGATAAAPPAPALTQTTPPTAAGSTTTPSLTQPSTAAQTTTQSSNTTAALSGTASATQSEEREAYQAAFDTLKEGRYRQAKTELKTFLARYPNSSFAGNAQYWLGEAHYVTKNFDEGIVEFRKVMENYPSSNKVPDALLKLGYTYYELKQFDNAKAVLQQLRDQYPNSTASRLASKRLDRIRREGH